MKYIDLHVHSTCSDGTFSPTELVALAKKTGLSAFALTDHDTVKGVPEAMAAGKKEGIEVLPGIEFSTEYNGKDIHVVGLEFDYESPVFLEEIQRFQDSRHLRNRKMIDKLREEGGIDISWEQMEAAFGEAVWTRAHFARYLLDHHYIETMQEAFSRYVGDNCPYFVPREKVTPEQAVALIRKTGGIPVLAHPLQYHLPDGELRTLVHSLKKEGLIGIEALYSTHSQTDENYVRHLARLEGIQISGGSDFHGSNKPTISLGTGRGNLKISYDILTNLREARDK